MKWMSLFAAAGVAAAVVPCSISGELQHDNSCKCDPGFRGPDCVALDFGLPEAAQAGLDPVFGADVDAGARQWTWGGSPMRAVDGKYHLFFSWFPFPDKHHTIKNWYNTSVVAHAVSDRPTGGFKYSDVIFPPRGGDFFDGTTTHNPTITHLPDGTFAIYYIGLNCVKYPDHDSRDCIKHQWIGVAHATDLNGPWERLPEPVLDGKDGQSWEGGMVANPSVVPLANGTLLMAYRGLNDRGIGMATSPSWDRPFTRLNNGDAVLGPDSYLKTAVDEDLSLWRNSRGIQMIFHQEGRGSNVGAHAYSIDDGLSWTVAGDAFDLTVVTDTTGGSVSYTRRERPQFVKGEDGQPTHMFNGVEDTEGGYTHTIVTPLNLAEHDLLV